MRASTIRCAHVPIDRQPASAMSSPGVMILELLGSPPRSSATLCDNVVVQSLPDTDVVHARCDGRVIIASRRLCGPPRAWFHPSKPGKSPTRIREDLFFL